MLGVGRGEGTKVVLAGKKRGRGRERGVVDGTRPPERSSCLERRTGSAREDAITIRARRRGEPGVEARVGAPRDAELRPRRERRVERAPQRLLDRPQAWLARPAAKARPVVLERQL